MQGWLVAHGLCADGRRVAPGGHVYDTGFDIPLADVRAPFESVLQTAGSVGGMLMAGALLVVLGLAAVAVWQGHASALLRRVFGSDATVDASAAEATEAEREGATVDTESAVEPEPEAAEPTDREMIVDILEDNDGRMKQAKIVDDTGWSKSKVSMLLSEMEDEGDITKLRVGRENIISLSGNEPDAAGSPFDSQ